MKQYETLGVKLDTSVAASFQTWCKEHGMKTAEALGYLVQCVLQSTKAEAIHNEKLRQVVQMWDNFNDIDKVGKQLLSKSKLEVIEAIYLVSEKGKLGSMPILVEPSFFDEPKYSTNIDEIVDELFSSCLRGLNRRLRYAARRLDTNGIQDTITALLTYYEQNEDEIANEIAEMFSDNARHEYGRTTEMIKYKRHNKQELNQYLMHFTDEQGQELPEDNREREMEEPEPPYEADG